MTATMTAAEAAMAAAAVRDVVLVDIKKLADDYKALSGRATAKDVDWAGRAKLEQQMKKIEYALLDAQSFCSRLGQMRAAMLAMPRLAVVVLDDKDIDLLSKGRAE